MAEAQKDYRAGIPVDAGGGPTIDPTKNVLDILARADKRQDDLRELNNELSKVRIECQQEISALRDQHAKEVREIETKRLDAVHQVNVLAGSTAAERAQVAIQTLAATAATERETLRSMVATTAQTIAAQNASQQAALTERIAALEKSSYEGKGRQTLSDPAMAEMVLKMEQVALKLATGGGKIEGYEKFIGWIIAAGAIVWAALK